jgi:hypothetical protein
VKKRYETKFEALEKERPDEMEMAKKAHEKTKEKTSSSLNI